MTKQAKQKCQAQNSQGKPCGNYALPDDSLCRAHRSIADYAVLSDRVTELQYEVQSAESCVATAALSVPLDQLESLPPAVREAVKRWHEVNDDLARAWKALGE